MSFAKTGLFALLTFAILIPVTDGFARPQTAGWRLVKVKAFEDVPVEKTKMVTETDYRTETVTMKKPVTQTETRYRRQVVKKPVEEARERVEWQKVYRPVTETRYREQQVETTKYRTVTRYRDEEYTVREPVIETSYEEEQYTVRKPVTRELVEVQETTSYKPVVETKTEYVAQPTVSLRPVYDPYARPRLQLLRPGYYTDPATGMTVYRRGGLHWAQPSTVIPVADTAPTLVPEQKTETRLVPETVVRKRPVEVTEMVEETRVRKVPVEVERMVTRTRTRKVPYQVEEPYTVVETRRIPYTETVMEESEVKRIVPYTETVMKEVTVEEPYQVEVERWVPYETTRRVPYKVQRPVTTTEYQRVATFRWMKVRVDAEGNAIGEPVELTDFDRIEAGLEPEAGSDAADQVPSIESSVQETSTARRPGRVFSGEATPVEDVPVDGIRRQLQRPTLTDDGAGADSPTVEPPARPENVDSEQTGDETAADRPIAE